MADHRSIFVKRSHRLPAGTADGRLGAETGEQLGLVIPGANDEIAVKAENGVTGTDS
jgi:hypothetical protein